ncbi:MAG TPA: Ku protein [Thermoanaerobaculia bacterium]
MTARAMWKGVLRIGKTEVPVKLYSAVQDHTVHFRLLHKTDKEPVKQQLIDSESEEPIEYEQTRKAYKVARDRFVALEREELEELEPPAARDIEITRFVAAGEIDHRWYERAYYLGPDDSNGAYFALAEAMRKKEKEAIAKWVMRKKQYVGALRAEDGYLMLIALRHADQIVDSAAIDAPQGRALDPREVAMAGQLLAALADRFEPTEYQDEYRARVMELIETKAKGGKVKVTKFRPRQTGEAKLTGVLEASLRGLEKERKAAGGRR